VRSLDAFRLRYGSSFDSLLVGQFTGSLSNGGEQIVVETPSEVIRSFSYGDSLPWPECADGDGISLILLAPASNPDHSLAFNWIGSAQIGGLPGGQPRALTYAEWQAYSFGPGQSSGPEDDPDLDGLPNLIEFYLGSLPGKNDTSNHAPQGSLVDDGGEKFLTLTFSEVAGQSGLTGSVQVSPDLENWSSDPEDIVELFPVLPNGNGSVQRTFRVLTPLSADAKQFVRLRVIQN
jgi:hypothetical protein